MNKYILLLYIVTVSALLEGLYKWNKSTSVSVFKKQHGDFYLGDYIAPKTRYMKYPILFEHFLSRVLGVAIAYGVSLDGFKVYRMNNEGILQAKSELKGKGGIYVWYCHITGFFYVGSGRVFFGKNGRLNTYLMKSRLVGEYRHISPDLAKALVDYGYDAFSLVILEQFDAGIDVEQILYQEQLWMMLYPTYNRSLKVSSNEGQPMLEEDRRAVSTNVYQYEVDNGRIVSDSEQVHYGIKQLVRTGFTSLDKPNVVIPMSYFDLNLLLKSNAIYKDRFLFTTEQMVGDALNNWEASFNTSTELTKGADKRSFGIYVYKYVGPNATYTSADFMEFIPSVAECRRKYSISKTHFQRIRKYANQHNGLVFSDYKLH